MIWLGTTLSHILHNSSVLGESESPLTCNTEKDRHTHLNARTAGMYNNHMLSMQEWGSLPQSAGGVIT
jgi:hypothetical protein